MGRKSKPLYRDKSGIFYARFYEGSRRIMLSLGTSGSSTCLMICETARPIPIPMSAPTPAILIKSKANPPAVTTAPDTSPRMARSLPPIIFNIQE